MTETRAHLLGVLPQFRVADLIRTADYYRDVLGFTVEDFFGDPPVFTQVRRDHAVIQLGQVDGGEQTAPAYGVGCNAYLWADDVDRLATEYRQRGADIVEGPTDRSYSCRELVVRDCNGLRLCFGQNLSELDFDRPDFGTFYDELPLWSAPFGLLLLERVPLKTGITILDVGAGTGFLSLELAQRCGSSATVIAVDPWQAALERLREKLDYLGIKNVRLVESDAARLDLPDASIDLIVSNLGINNFEKAETVMEKCFRLARPGAHLVLTTNVVGHMQELYDVYRSTLLELDLGDRLPAFEAHVEHRGTVESVTALLEHAGFQIAGVTTRSFQMRFADGSSLLRHHFIRLGFLPDWKRVVPSGLVEKTFALLEEKLNDVAESCGSLDLTIPVVCVEARRPVAG